MLRAPAKLNLCLYLGRVRADGLHELRSLFCNLALADRLVIGEAEGELRATHLRYHLAMTDLLSPEQIRRYAELRGHSGEASGSHHAPRH